LIIQCLAFEPYRFTLTSPLQTARGEIACREGFVISIGDRQGLVGYGEATPLDGLAMEPLGMTRECLANAQRSLVNMQISSLADIENLLSEYEPYPAARHGLELALVDLYAKQQGLTLPPLIIKHFGGVIHLPKVNAVIGAIAPQLAVIKAQGQIQAGYRCLKIKVGSDDFATDWQRVAAVRSQVGNDIQIRIDANQAWTEAAAIANLNKLAPLDIEYVEQPVPFDDLAAMARLRRSQPIAIAADESVNHLAQLQQIINRQAADIVILKPMVLGGILTTHRAAIIALDAGLDVVITTTLDGVIACQGAMDLASTLPITRACGLSTLHLAR
jgi:o-succinylbenzoate synthase